MKAIEGCFDDFYIHCVSTSTIPIKIKILAKAPAQPSDNLVVTAFGKEEKICIPVDDRRLNRFSEILYKMIHPAISISGPIIFIMKA